jgi:hypothetical protein
VRKLAVAVAVVVAVAALVSAVRGAEQGDAPVLIAENESGAARTINVAGFAVLAKDNPFFQALGTNGRAA